MPCFIALEFDCDFVAETFAEGDRVQLAWLAVGDTAYSYLLTIAGGLTWRVQGPTSLSAAFGPGALPAGLPLLADLIAAPAGLPSTGSGGLAAATPVTWPRLAGIGSLLSVVIVGGWWIGLRRQARPAGRSRETS